MFAHRHNGSMLHPRDLRGSEQVAPCRRKFLMSQGGTDGAFAAHKSEPDFGGGYSRRMSATRPILSSTVEITDECFPSIRFALGFGSGEREARPFGLSWSSGRSIPSLAGGPGVVGSGRARAVPPDGLPRSSFSWRKLEVSGVATCNRVDTEKQSFPSIENGVGLERSIAAERISLSRVPTVGKAMRGGSTGPREFQTRPGERHNRLINGWESRAFRTGVFHTVLLRARGLFACNLIHAGRDLLDHGRPLARGVGAVSRFLSAAVRFRNQVVPSFFSFWSAKPSRSLVEALALNLRINTAKLDTHLGPPNCAHFTRIDVPLVFCYGQLLLSNRK